MKRIGAYVSEKQLERLKERSEKEGVAIAELMRRAIDTFLAWDDPTYQPTPPQPQIRKSHSSPP